MIALDNGVELCVAVVNGHSEKIDKGDAVEMNIFFTLDCIFRGTADGLVFEPMSSGDGLRVLHKRCFDKCEYFRPMPIAAVSGKVINAYGFRRSLNTYFIQGGAFEYRISCAGKEFSVLHPIITYDKCAPSWSYTAGDVLVGNYEAVARIIKKI